MSTEAFSKEHIGLQYLRQYLTEDQQLEALKESWLKKHRPYHNATTYLTPLLERLLGVTGLSQEERDSLVLAAYFHVAVYDPREAHLSESASCELLTDLCSSAMQDEKQEAIVQHSLQIVKDTQYHQSQSELSAVFCEAIMDLACQSFQSILQWEQLVFQEYRFLDYPIYKHKRMGVLQDLRHKYPQHAQALQFLWEYLRDFQPHVGIYAGSFCPFHCGHLNIVEKAEQIFDKVIIAQGRNPAKTPSSCSVPNYDLEQVQVLRYRQHESFVGFLTDYLASKESACKVTFIRGLRNGADLDYEVNQLRFMEGMKPSLQVAFIPCDKQYEHISSTALRNLENIQEGSGARYLPL